MEDFQVNINCENSNGKEFRRDRTSARIPMRLRNLCREATTTTVGNGLSPDHYDDAHLFLLESKEEVQLAFIARSRDPFTLDLQALVHIINPYMVLIGSILLFMYSFGLIYQITAN